MASDDQLRRHTVYRHLDYRWHAFGIGLPHVALAALPGCAWGALVALISPDGFDLSALAACFVAASGAGILDAFRPVALPTWGRGQGLSAGALPGLALLLGCLLPREVRTLLPLWPALPLCLGALVAMAIWQYRREPGALLVAWRWHVGPRLYDGHVAAKAPTAPLAIDYRFSP